MLQILIHWMDSLALWETTVLQYLCGIAAWLRLSCV